MADATPFTILYIAGSGRSGSTLLEQLLAEVDGTCPVGELRMVWRRGVEHDHRCGCGQPFSACPFWQEVVARGFGEMAASEAREIQELADSVERARYMPGLLAPSGLRSSSFDRRLREYAEVLKHLFQAIRDVSGAEVIIDNSKEPPYGLCLQRIPGERVAVVHLVRDSRAVAYSRQRLRVNPQIHWTTQSMKRYPVWSTALEWNRRNILAEAMRLTGVEYRRIRYEDLTSDPEGQRGRLVEWALQRRGFRLRGTSASPHTVSGNPMRFERKRRPVQPDAEWTSTMSARSRRVVSLLTLPLLARYDYL